MALSDGIGDERLAKQLRTWRTLHSILLPPIDSEPIEKKYKPLQKTLDGQPALNFGIRTLIQALDSGWQDPQSVSGLLQSFAHSADYRQRLDVERILNELKKLR